MAFLCYFTLQSKTKLLKLPNFLLLFSFIVRIYQFFHLDLYHQIANLCVYALASLIAIQYKIIRACYIFFAFRSIFNRNVVFHIPNSTHKCNLSVRPFVMVAKLAKKYSGKVGMPSFFLGLLFSLLRMKIIEQTVLRTFPLGQKSDKSSCKNFFLGTEIGKDPGLFQSLYRGKFPTHRSFCFSMRFSQAYRPHVQGRKRRNRGEICRFDNGKGFCPELSARKPRFHWLPFLSNDMEVQSKHLYRVQWQCPYVRFSIVCCGGV